MISQGSSEVMWGAKGFNREGRGERENSQWPRGRRDAGATVRIGFRLEDRLKNAWLVFVILAGLPLFAQTKDLCAAIDAAKTKTYGFRPSKLTTKERQQKSVQMDSFWRLVGEDKSAGSQCLQALLSAEKQDGFFLFDGASLLYSLDQSELSSKVVSASVERADM